MSIDFLQSVFEEHRGEDAIVWRDEAFAYGWLLDRIKHWRERLRAEGTPRGAVVTLEADFSPNSVALFLALVDHGCILVPLTSSVDAKKPEFLAIARPERRFVFDASDALEIRAADPAGELHPHYAALRGRGHPGLVLFSSGSTGRSKAAVHDMTKLLEKFRVKRRSMRAISFLLYDHIGGINTMLYSLSNAGCLITVTERSPDAVLGAVARHRAELLPTSPTFLNLVLLSEAYARHDLRSLRMVTYGTEPMPESTLRRVHEVLPGVELLQTYGLSELGILRSKSKSSDSLWVKIGGEGFETRVEGGILQIKASSAMLGYLNAPSPFTEDGWFHTGDEVEVDGEYVRILGRRSELIIVGGEKVYPAEVEGVIQELPNIAEASVYGEKNALTGNTVCARVSLVAEEDPRELAKRIRRYCASKLQAFKVPRKIEVVGGKQHGERFKKMRGAGEETERGSEEG